MRVQELFYSIRYRVSYQPRWVVQGLVSSLNDNTCKCGYRKCRLTTGKRNSTGISGNHLKAIRNKPLLTLHLIIWCFNLTFVPNSGKSARVYFANHLLYVLLILEECFVYIISSISRAIRVVWGVINNMIAICFWIFKCFANRTLGRFCLCFICAQTLYKRRENWNLRVRRSTPGAI